MKKPLWRQLRADAVSESQRLRKVLRWETKNLAAHARQGTGPYSHRFSVEPLAELFRSREPWITAEEICERIGVHRRTWFHWLDNGIIEQRADEIATQLDLHPALIWTEWFEVTGKDTAA